MVFNTLPKKFAVSILIACGSIVWLNKWHQYVYTRSRIDFPPVSNWVRDSILVLIPIMLAVWAGAILTQRITDRFGNWMSASTQSMVTASILGSMSTMMILLVEGSRNMATGIGYEFVFLASICNRVYPNGNTLLDILKRVFPGAQALRLHILLRDGANLALFNLAIIILVIMLHEWFLFVRTRKFFVQEPV